MQRQMNLKIKFRESFRPFAPAVLLERVHEYFDLNRPSPYMLFVARIAEAQRLRPATIGATGHRPAERPPVDDPGGDPR